MNVFLNLEKNKVDLRKTRFSFIANMLLNGCDRKNANSIWKNTVTPELKHHLKKTTDTLSFGMILRTSIACYVTNKSSYYSIMNPSIVTSVEGAEKFKEFDRKYFK